MQYNSVSRRKDEVEDNGICMEDHASGKERGRIGRRWKLDKRRERKKDGGWRNEEQAGRREQRRGDE